MTNRIGQPTKAYLNQFVECPEPSTEGDWFTASLDDLKASGWTHIEFHFNSNADDDAQPNQVRFLDED